MNSEIILEHFSNLNSNQKKQIDDLYHLYVEWNSKINVISRKDIENIYLHHVLHSLSIAKLITFSESANILDIGTGGGFPGIPLAIINPNTHFHLIDSIGKKIHVVKEVCKALDLKNVTAEHTRMEDHKNKYDFILSRAVTRLPEFIKWTKGSIKEKKLHELKNGILYLKGGNLDEELKEIRQNIQIYNISEWFSDVFFIEKKIVHIYS